MERSELYATTSLDACPLCVIPFEKPKTKLRGKMIKKKIALMLIASLLLSCANNNTTTNEIADSSVSVSNDNANLDDIEKEESIKYTVELGDLTFDLDNLFDFEMLHKLNLNELGFLRNAIYAKHGHTFKTDKYSIFFEQFEWYVPTNLDVSHLLTETDRNNIRELHQLEMSLTYVEKSFYKVNTESKSLLFSFSRLSGGNESGTFHQFQIYDDSNLEMRLVFDTIEIDGIDFYVSLIDGYYESIISFYDANADGREDVLVNMIEDFSDSMMILLEKEDKYEFAFSGSVNQELKFKDVNDDGLFEVINYHTGGGGYIQIWTGLELVNEYKNGMYSFSYELSKLYYSKLIEEHEDQFGNDPTEKNLANLLNLYADAGLSEMCIKTIEKNQSLIENTDFDYSEHYSADPQIASDFFEYVVARAYYYENEWDSMKDW